MINEDQYKSPSGKHRRMQSVFPSSFNDSKSFGGIGANYKLSKKRSRKKSIYERIDTAMICNDESISEEQQVIKTAEENGGAYLAPHRGQFIIDGKVIIGNHADLLKVLVNWFVDNDLDSLKRAIHDIKTQIQHGATYAEIETVSNTNPADSGEEEPNEQD